MYLDSLAEYAYFDGPEDKLAYKAPHPWPIGNDRPSDVTLAVVFGPKKYATLPVPILAMVAYPHKMPERIQDDLDEGKAFLKAEKEYGARLDHLQRDNKAAHIVHLANANHDLLRSNQADVLREIGKFVAGLK